MKKRKQQPRKKHVPERTCIACRTRSGKRELVRVVRLAEEGAGVVVDETGKQKGRGAYLCRQRVCWDNALKRGSLNRALRTTLTPENIAALAAYAADLPEHRDVVQAVPLADKNLAEEE
jgi:hypothetical protein